MRKVNKAIRKTKAVNKDIYIILTMLSEVVVFLCNILASIIRWVFELITGLFKHKVKGGYTSKDAIKCLNSLSPRGFEVFCGELFRQRGYRDVKVTQATNDYGRDIIMKDKDDNIVFVECKYYKDKKIGREICQKILGSVDMFKANKAIVITSSTFHKNALEVQKMVGKDKLELIDMQVIINTLNQMDVEKLGRIIMKSSNCA